MPIRDLSSLRRHLQWAIELEHSTIPPYLTALYSLHEGSNQEARRVLLSIAIEEMLHMTLAANVLNAVGGKPRLDHREFLPHYPSYLPHSDKSFQVPLQKFSREAVEVFLKIEKPAPHGALPEDENYETIGQFYEAIEEAMEHLVEKHGEAHVFCGDPSRQIGPEAFHYDGGGQVIIVTDLASARRAMEEIIEQGEGLDHGSIWDGDRSMFHHAHMEVSHYFRFQELLLGRYFKHGDTPHSGPHGRVCAVDWDAVYNIRPNVRTADFPHGSEAREKLTDFNRTYCDLLRRMHRAFNGEPGQMALAVGEMYEVKVKAAELVQMPSGDGLTTVGISYEYVAPEESEADTATTHAHVEHHGHHSHHDHAHGGHAHHHTPVPPRIHIRAGGPYIVEGEVPLRVRTRVMTEQGEALTWKNGQLLRERGPYALCRCGRSDSKPFCDGSHARTHMGEKAVHPFVGKETADPAPRAHRAKAYPGPRLVVHHDRTICAFSTFCENKITDVWAMAEQTGDTATAAQVIAMVERCPSGALTYEMLPDGETIEPSLPREVAVTDNGPLWVTGGVPIERADGQPCETRNRVTLCRCGHSKNKPYCDGNHIDIKFQG